MAGRSRAQARDLAEYLRFHTARGYYIKRNGTLGILVFLWVTTFAGVYSFDLWLLTPILLVAVGSWAVVRSQYRRFRDPRYYALTVAVVDSLFITAAVYALGGAGSAGTLTVYTYPIVYHSLRRRRLEIYLIANVAAAMYSAMIALECFGILPYRNVLGFAQPPPITYLGLAVGTFLFLNLAALTGDAVTQEFAQLWNIKEDLEQNQQKLRRLTAETEFIASAISHELKNPLSAAANAADLLVTEAESGKPEDTRELAGIVRHNVTKAYDMLTDLRQLLIAVNKEEPVEDVQLRDLIASVLREVAIAGRLSNAEVDIHTNLPPVNGPPQKLAQIFRNLFLNALEHGSAGARSILRIECAGSDTVPGFVRFAVSDGGRGIPLEHRERIFEPFVTLGERGSEGRGLGLALVKRVVNEAGGRIWVEESELGGAKFVFTLPAPAASEARAIDESLRLRREG
jgi:signal transduction histidine kinase